MSKLILYDWRCTECNLKYEGMAKMVELKGTCPECGSESKRLISTPRITLDGTDDAFSTAYDKWGKIHEDEHKRNKKMEAEHGPDW